MKRIVISLLIIALAVSLAACANQQTMSSESEASQQETATPAQQPSESTPEPAVQPTPEPTTQPTPEPTSQQERYTPTDLFSDEFNPFGMDWSGIFTVQYASFDKGSSKMDGKNPFILTISAEGNMYAAVAYISDVSVPGLSEQERNDRFNDYSEHGFIEFTGTDGRIVTIRQQKPHDANHENGECLIELRYDVPDAELDKYTDLIRDNYNMNALTSVKDLFNVETDFSVCGIGVDLQNKKTDIGVHYFPENVDEVWQHITETFKDGLGNWYGHPSAVLHYGIIDNTLAFDDRFATIVVVQYCNEINSSLGQYIEPELSP